MSMSFHVLSIILSASVDRFPDTHHLNQLRKTLLADHVKIYPAKDLFSDLESLPEGTLITLSLTHGLTIPDDAQHGVKYAVTDKLSKLQKHLYSILHRLDRGKGADVDITSLGTERIACRQELKQLRAEWPQGVPDHLKRKPVRDFNLEISAASLTTFACGSCNELCPITDKKLLVSRNSTLAYCAVPTKSIQVNLIWALTRIVSQSPIQERNLGSTLVTLNLLYPWTIPHMRAY
ncbi:hypothetical protein B0H13DRAFT_1910511 [Mycena leptocephala]|nr:hypothetical protein B0H13DRAFT_1910511 [Mycena leptocephala]